MRYDVDDREGCNLSGDKQWSNRYLLEHMGDKLFTVAVTPNGSVVSLSRDSLCESDFATYLQDMQMQSLWALMDLYISLNLIQNRGP